MMYKVSLKKNLPRRYASHNQFLQLKDTVFPSEPVLRIRTGAFYEVSVINLDADCDSKLYSTTEHCWGLSKFCIFSTAPEDWTCLITSHALDHCRKAYKSSKERHC